MKWFVYLFSLYLLTLSGFTCEGDSDCCSDQRTRQSSSTHHGDEHQTHGTCVPFLACGACNSILPNEILVSLPEQVSAIDSVPFYYLETAWTNAPGWIWQPPQIS
jgi:hypothetical protein